MLTWENIFQKLLANTQTMGVDRWDDGLSANSTAGRIPATEVSEKGMISSRYILTPSEDIPVLPTLTSESSRSSFSCSPREDHAITCLVRTWRSSFTGPQSTNGTGAPHLDHPEVRLYFKVTWRAPLYPDMFIGLQDKNVCIFMCPKSLKIIWDRNT